MTLNLKVGTYLSMYFKKASVLHIDVHHNICFTRGPKLTPHDCIKTVQAFL